MSSRVSQALWASLLTVCAFAVGCSSSPRGAPAKAENRKVAPNFNLPNSNGVQVALADYKGKVVLLNFWATWCGPRKIEIPWFIEFNET